MKNGILWHYTSASLECFISSDAKLHLNFAGNSCNDDNEINYGRTIFDEALKQLPQYSCYFPGAEYDYHKYSVSFANEFYIFCLTHCENSKPHWDEFCLKGGISIGFSRKKLEELIDGYRKDYVEKLESVMQSGISIFYKCEDRHQIYFWKCIYDRKEAIEKCKEVITKLIERYIDGDYGIISCALSLVKEQLVWPYKKNEFHKEAEYRIALRGPRLSEIMKTNGSQKYIETFFLDDSLIKYVFISPNGDVEHDYKEVEKLKSRYKRSFEIIKP